MDSQGIFCPNLDCPARGQSDQGTIRVHSQKDHRYRCTVCHRTFAATKGTPFYRLHAQREVFVSVVTLLAFGCPPAAIVAAFGLDERTVRAWQASAGSHSEQVHQKLVLQPHDLGQVQADGRINPPEKAPFSWADAKQPVNKLTHYFAWNQN